MGKKGLGMVNVCIPTLNAEDEFHRCIDSLMNSSVECNISVIFNGEIFSIPSTSRISTHKPLSNLGVAGSWNWFIDNVKTLKIISNDDIVFDKYAVERMLEEAERTPFNLIVPENLDSSFSCYLIPDSVIEAVGKFDEWISPRYGYFEDNDYSHRMSKKGVGIVRASGSYVEHAGSSTLKHFDKQKTREHHDKFRFAREHYKLKWGGEPGHERFATPFNR